MNNSKLLLIFVFFSILVGVGYSTSTNVSSCTNITSSGAYVLNSSLISSDGSSCILINVSDVVLDLNGYSISNATISNDASVYVYSPYIQLTNITIANGTVNSSNRGIYIKNVSDSIIRNVTSHDNYDGLYIWGGYNNTLTNNTIYNNPNHDGISLYGSSDNNTITYNIISNNWYGLSLTSGSNNNNLANNTVYSNHYGFYLEYSSGEIIVNNSVYDNSHDGFNLQYSNNNNITNNTIYNNPNHDGISLYGSSDNNTITYNTIHNNHNGFSLTGGSNNNNLANNTVYSNNYDGFYLQYSNNNNITNNSVYNNGYDGFYLQYSNNNNITNNTIYNNNEYGFNLQSSSGNTLINNTIQNNTQKDIHFQMISESYCNNIIEDNTGSGGYPIKFFNYSVNLHNEILSELILCNADHSNITNITVKGLDTLRNNGLFVGFSDYSNFTDINSSNNYLGFYLYDSSNNNITNSIANNILPNGIANNDGGWGFRLSSHSNNNILINNTAFNNGRDGFYSHASHNNTLTSNNASNNHYGGFSLDSCFNDTFASNNASNNDGTGFYLTYTHDSNFTNNTAYNDSYGFHLHDSCYSNTIINNKIYDSRGDGFHLDSASSSILANNTVYNNSGDGFYLNGAHDNVLVNNTVYNNSGDSFYLDFYDSNNNITSNNAYNNSENGFYLGYHTHDNNLTLNNVYNNFLHGFYLDSSSNNIILNNTINCSKDLFIDSASSGNNIYYNYFYNGSDYYVNNTATSSNNMNTSVSGVPQGNYYEDILNYSIYDTNLDSYGDSGSQYPYNASMPKFFGNDPDYGPIGARQDSTEPSVQFVPQTDSSGITKTDEYYIQVNVNASDSGSGLKNITIYLYNSTSLVNSSTSTTSPFFYNFTGLSDGIYYFNSTAYDNAENYNSTETRNVTIVPPPSSSNNGNKKKTMSLNYTFNCSTGALTVLSKRDSVGVSNVRLTLTETSVYPPIVSVQQTVSSGQAVFTISKNGTYNTQGTKTGYYAADLNGLTLNLCVEQEETQPPVENNVVNPPSEKNNTVNPQPPVQNINQSECKSNNDCLSTEYCSGGTCTEVVGTCGYVKNHEWISYECCDNSKCDITQKCVNHQCTNIIYSMNVPKNIMVGQDVTAKITANTNPAPGVKVTMKSPSGKIVNTITNKNGELKFNALEDGEYTLKATVGNKTVAERVVSVEKSKAIVSNKNSLLYMLKKNLIWIAIGTVAILGGAFYYMKRRGSGVKKIGKRVR